MRNRRHMVRNRKARHFGPPPNNQAAFATLWRFLELHHRRQRSCGNRCKKSRDSREDLIGLEITGNYKNGVVRLIVAAIVSLLLLDGRPFDILKPPDDGVP